jgi:hypothetical protein
LRLLGRVVVNLERGHFVFTVIVCFGVEPTTPEGTASRLSALSFARLLIRTTLNSLFILNPCTHSCILSAGGYGSVERPFNKAELPRQPPARCPDTRLRLRATTGTTARAQRAPTKNCPFPAAPPLKIRANGP